MAFLNTEKISEKYKTHLCFWGLKPNKFVTKIPTIIKGGKILDIGVGEGRNALFLAKKGFEVVGVDVSKEAINKFLKIAEKENLRVSGVASDIVNFKMKGKYKAIICVATLHLVSKNEIVRTIRRMQKYTENDGINLITVFTKKDIGSKEYPHLYFFDNNELKNLYRDWKIIVHKNYTKKETHGKPHEHHICVLIAKKKEFAAKE